MVPMFGPPPFLSLSLSLAALGVSGDAANPILYYVETSDWGGGGGAAVNNCGAGPGPYRIPILEAISMASCDDASRMYAFLRPSGRINVLTLTDLTW